MPQVELPFSDKSGLGQDWQRKLEQNFAWERKK
jgi:hypothetical protein